MIFNKHINRYYLRFGFLLILGMAALVLGEADVLARVEALVPKIVKAASEGFTPAGGMIYEKCGGGAYERCGDGPEGTDAEVDADRHWWVQAESVVGYFNLWEHFGQPDGLENAIMCWEFIKNRLLDRGNGG